MTEPRWLSAEELRDWLSFAVVVQLLPSRLERPLQQEAGLTYFEYLVLAMLSEAPGRALRMSQLARLTASSLSRLSHVMSRLERRGWTCRVPCPDDRRATVAELTDSGFEKLVAAAPVHVESVREIVLDALTPSELAQLGELSRLLLKRIDPDGTIWAAHAHE